MNDKTRQSNPGRPTCSHCRGELIQLPWTEGQQVTVCNNVRCHMFRQPQDVPSDRGGNGSQSIAKRRDLKT
ncbi:MAG: hypothetical protein PHQ43_00525 [Dehalococcoidales bacterium]|nr:hypothetical protein [Dehalococcoidales bacterium]